MTALRDCLDEVRPAIRKALGIVREYQTGSTPGEIADCAHDQIDTTCYLTPSEEWELEAALVREALFVLGLDGGASDATFVSDDALREAEERMDGGS